MITIDLDKAKEICRNNIRIERIQLLEALDILYLRALENNDINEQKRIAFKKQLLRDLPNSEKITKASTIQELQSFNPLAEINLYE